MSNDEIKTLIAKELQKDNCKNYVFLSYENDITSLNGVFSDYAALKFMKMMAIERPKVFKEFQKTIDDFMMDCK